jgi:demethylmenaquinone methyltransferase / 2-methoxy-6-polyprenyl-1,4-benzoquinol methylase
MLSSSAGDSAPVSRSSPDLSKSPARIAGMFDAIAGRYDFLNHLLSAGIDRRWRARAVRSLDLRGGERVLDVCTGTADLAIAALRARPAAHRAIGVDFADAMLRVGQSKLRRNRLDGRLALVRGDAARLPVADRSVDALTIGFGIRNVEDAAAACREFFRVLKPGGRIAVLEFAVPTTPVVGDVYLWYLRHVLPRVGAAVSRNDEAYGYLPASIDAFATPDAFVKTLRQTGFSNISAVRLTLGAVCLYGGTKAGG